MVTDNIFKYQIILSDKIVLLIIITILYVFNLLIELQYNLIKFKRLFII